MMEYLLFELEGILKVTTGLESWSRSSVCRGLCPPAGVWALGLGTIPGHTWVNSLTAEYTVAGGV